MPKSLRQLITDSWRLILDPPAPGPHNMAVDEVLLTAGSVPTVRIYSWSRPTVSYGIFQKHESFPLLAGWDRVRRPTGGGAIAHHQELTFSLTGPSSHPLLCQTEKFYQHVHDAWRDSLQATCGIRIACRGGPRQRPTSIWCFMDSDPLDMVAENGHKLIGSAQRRTKDRVLLHGSLPLVASNLMGGTGLAELGGPDNIREAWRTLGNSWLCALSINPVSGCLTERETAQTEEILHLHYASFDFRVKRSTRRLQRS